MNMTRLQATSPAQTHSRDYGVRVDRKRLQAISFEHLCSDEASEVREDTRLHPMSTSRAGITEWHARVDGIAVSMAWDWMQLNDGAMCLLRQVAPRSNLQMVDAQGYDLRGHEALELLWEKIGNIAWQKPVESALPIYLDR